MISHPVSLTPAEVRAIVLRSQGLADNEAPFGFGKPAVLKAVEHLGYVQVDPINVIQRAHHHVLWSRVPDYSPDMLHEFSLPLMRKYRRRLHWSDESPELRKSMRRLLSMIRKNGPLMISDVESAGSVKGWSAATSGKIERRALHELWMRGDIMIRSRRGGVQKIFDLSSRVLPTGTNVELPSKREAAEFHVRRTLRALGVASRRELHYLQDAGQADVARTALSSFVNRGEAIELRATN